jgi:hypothetical protein
MGAITLEFVRPILGQRDRAKVIDIVAYAVSFPRRELEAKILSAFARLFVAIHCERMFLATSATLEPKALWPSASKWIPSSGLRLTMAPASRK